VACNDNLSETAVTYFNDYKKYGLSGNVKEMVTFHFDSAIITNEKWIPDSNRLSRKSVLRFNPDGFLTEIEHYSNNSGKWDLDFRTETTLENNIPVRTKTIKNSELTRIDEIRFLNDSVIEETVATSGTQVNLTSRLELLQSGSTFKKSSIETDSEGITLNSILLIEHQPSSNKTTWTVEERYSENGVSFADGVMDTKYTITGLTIGKDSKGNITE